MKFAFQELPSAGGGDLTPRPVIPVFLEGIDVAPFACLVDSGALRTRFSRELAQVAGIDLDAAPRSRFAVGGVVVEAADARATLRVGSEAWDAAVSFCEPWPFDFQLLGLDGFLRHFRVTISGYEEWCELEVEPSG